MIYVESKRKKYKNLISKYPNARIVDLTSKSESDFKKFSPFYPHGKIPVPFSKDTYSYSVEGVWQGLKVFETNDIDLSKFSIHTMVGIKRTIKSNGKIIGHRNGIYGNKLLNYSAARKKIFIKTYLWTIENRLSAQLNDLKNYAKSSDLVFLDYETSNDIDNLSKPISHALLVKLLIEKQVKVYTKPIQTKLDF